MDYRKILQTIGEGLKLMGSAGGLIYLVTLLNLYRNRVRIKVRRVEDESKNDVDAAITFEAENLGSAPTSIEPMISFSAFLPRPKRPGGNGVEMKPFRFSYMISETSRTLQPHVPVVLRADSNETSRDVVERIGFMYFKTYTFSFTRGRRQKVRIYSADGASLNLFQYWWNRILVLLFGTRGFKKPKDRSPEVARALST